MARPQESPTFPTTYGAGDHYEEAATATGCGCFRRFCFGRDDSGSRRFIRQEDGEGFHRKETWLVEKFKKLRELSEVVAGPRWKNLIRKIGKIFNGREQNKMAAQFRYSPEGYARNFAGDCQDDDAILMRSFSARFAPGFSAIDQQNNPPIYVIDY